MKRYSWYGVLLVIMILVWSGCSSVPVTKLYVLNYEPVSLKSRRMVTPYPYTIRIKSFDINQTYDRSQIVYRNSPFEMGYYYYKNWAINPADMFTDMVRRHMGEVKLVSRIIQRLDEGGEPDFELNGMLEALEEFDSEGDWFAHLAFRINLVRISDNTMIYSRRFDTHKQVYEHKAEFVVRELSRIMDYLITEAIRDIDQELFKEFNGER